ncbi:hypothetical protein F5H01DRAFT_338067, partial [Linnemannia elongata]
MILLCTLYGVLYPSIPLSIGPSIVAIIIHPNASLIAKPSPILPFSSFSLKSLATKVLALLCLLWTCAIFFFFD